MATKHSCKETIKVLKFWILWIFCFLPLALATTSNVSDHDIEIMNLLKKLNKPYVKSIKSPDGSIIDCVPLHLQPAFDNPLLKNHTIQMQPSFLPKESSRNHSSTGLLLPQPWHAYGRCPKGTTPIRRTTKEDILRAKSIQSYGKKTHGTFPKPTSGRAGQTNDDVNEHEYAVRVLEQGKFYGARASVNVWIPFIEVPIEFSLAQIWVSAGNHNTDLNTVEAGWQVYNHVYDDDSAHLFGFWTRDAYKETGCYNLACDGFVQVSQDVGLGALIRPASEYESNQVELSIYVAQDRNTNNWWLLVDQRQIGYWPASLFTHLQGPSTSIHWGGEVTNKAIIGQHTTTEMGSGFFASEGYTKAAYFADLQVVDESNHLISPPALGSIVSKSSCYDLVASTSDTRGEFFFFGGPGYNDNCR